MSFDLSAPGLPAWPCRNTLVWHPALRDSLEGLEGIAETRLPLLVTSAAGATPVSEDSDGSLFSSVANCID